MSDTVQKHSQELASQLWAIANDLRGNMDASKFKDYILGVIFYRYLSEKTENYMNDLLKDDGITYKDALKDEDYAETVKEWSIEHLGYIIQPKYLWSSLIDEIKDKWFTIEHFEKAISSLVESTIGQESEAAFDKLFDDMNLQDKDLGKEVSNRTELISKVMQNVNVISFNVDNAEIDVLGTAYMILISLFASDAGKKGGEFFTPTCASKLLARLATVGLTEAKNVADSCAGSGSLLLEVQNLLSADNIGHFYATEKNGSNYNLLRMNLLMHNVPYKKFTCFNDDSISNDNYYEDGKPILFRVQVENPPYSSKYNQNKKLLEDPRFSAAGVLTPQGKADLLFVENMVYHMDDDGRIAVLLPSGALFRGKEGKNGKKNDAEYDIRKYLIENLNVIDAIIGLPPKMFHGAKLPVIVMVLKKKRGENNNNILFIDAASYFTSEKTMNVITEEDIDRIVEAYKNRSEIEKFSHVAPLDEVRENNYNCNIPRYVNNFDYAEDVNFSYCFDQVAKLTNQSSEIETKLSLYFEELGIKNTLSNKVTVSNDLFSGKLRFCNANGNDYPQWDYVVMDETFDPVSDKNHPEKTVLTIIQGQGTIARKDSGRKISYDEKAASGYKLVQKNDFIVHLRSFEGGLEIATCEGIVSPAYTILRSKIEIVPEFYRYYFRSPNFIKGKLARITEGIRDGRSLNMDDFWILEIPYPSIEEQKKIADFIGLLDEQIRIEKQKVDALVQIKNGFQLKMFS